MRWLIPELIRWNVIVTLVSVALTLAGQMIAGGGVDVEMLVLVACGTFVVYGADRRAIFAPEDRDHGQPIPPVPTPAWVVAFAVLSVLTWRLGRAGAGVVLGLGLLSALYVLPLLPGRLRLKDLPYLKAVLVAIGWALATMLLPLVQAHAIRPTDWQVVGSLVLYRTIFLLPNALLADWPDRESDRAAGIRTVANQLSTASFVRLCRILCLAGIGLGTVLSCAHLLPSWALFELATPIGFLLLLARALPLTRHFYATVADLLVAWPGAVVIFFIK